MLDPGGVRRHGGAVTDLGAKRILLLLMCAAAVVFATQVSPESHDGRRGPMVDGDGRYYYLVLRSVALDRDVDFTNDYARYGNWYFLGKTKTGRPANVFGIGPAVAWLPFFAIGHAIARDDGMSRIEQAVTLSGSFLYGCLAVWLCYRLARRWFSPAPSLLAVIAAWVGGPLLWYQIWEASYAHTLEACAASALLLAWVSWRKKLTWRRWAGIGALVGVLALMRPQAIVFALLPAFDWGLGPPVRRRPGFGPLLATVVAGLVFVPQMLMWHGVYGRALIVPQGTGFLRFTESMWSETLFSSRNGLFAWAPLWGAGAVGVIAFIRRSRRLGLLMLAIFGATAFVNGAAWDWWAGGAYGGRRYSALLPVITVGLGHVASAISARGRSARTLAAGGLGAVLALQLAFLVAYERRDITWDAAQPAAGTWGRFLGPPGRAILRWTGNPMSWPASLPFALRWHVAPARYETLVGPYALDERVPTTNPRRIGRRTEALSMVHSPFLIGPGRLLVPLNRTGRLTLRLEGKGEGALRWNGRAVAAGGLPLEGELDESEILRGLNDVHVDGPATTLVLIEGADWPPTWATTGAP